MTTTSPQNFEETGVIYFWPQFVKPILAGQKIQTRRAGPNRRFYIGQILEAVNSETEKTFAKLEVTNVFQQILKDISEHEAELDGFSSKDDFLKCIKTIYPNLNDDDTVTTVQFKPIGAYDTD